MAFESQIAAVENLVERIIIWQHMKLFNLYPCRSNDSIHACVKIQNFKCGHRCQLLSLLCECRLLKWKKVQYIMSVFPFRLVIDLCTPNVLINTTQTGKTLTWTLNAMSHWYAHNEVNLCLNFEVRIIIIDHYFQMWQAPKVHTQYTCKSNDSRQRGKTATSNNAVKIEG